MKIPWQRFDAPWVTLLATALVYLLFLAGKLAQCDGDPTRFITAGDRYVDRSKAPPSLSILKDSDGYDGQFYYRLALEPFTSETTAHGIAIDSPVYRQQRILYPLFAHLLAFGRAGFVPWALILVNYLALCAMGWLGGLYARARKQHALWGMVLPLYAGFLLTLCRDTTEILAAAFLLATCVSLQRKRTILAAVLLTLAVLARETTLLAALAVLPLLFIEDRPTAKRMLPVLLLPLVVYGAWQGWLRLNWGAFGTKHAGASLGIPFAGLIGSIRDVTSWGSVAQVLRLLEIGFILVFGLGTALALPRSAAEKHVKCAWLLYLVLVTVVSRHIWVEDWAFLRAFADFFLLGNLILLGTKVFWRLPILSAGLAFWLLLALHALGR